jgi:hypothetical protein
LGGRHENVEKEDFQGQSESHKPGYCRMPNGGPLAIANFGDQEVVAVL